MRGVLMTTPIRGEMHRHQVRMAVLQCNVKYWSAKKSSTNILKNMMNCNLLLCNTIDLIEYQHCMKFLAAPSLHPSLEGKLISIAAMLPSR